MTTRTSTLANIPAILADYSDESAVNEIIEAVEAAATDQYGSTLALLYGTAELHDKNNILAARIAAGL
jgi:hypothetical protein